MYIRPNDYEGQGGHIYRRLSDIRADILRVSEEIEQINSMLNIRDMLMRMLSSAAEDNPEDWLPELCELLDGAKEGLDEMRKLERTLSQLHCELADTKAALL